MNDELKRLLPVTADEAAMLHDMGWLRIGEGLPKERDWFHMPSEGPPTWVGEDERTTTRFMRDLESIRREIDERDRKQRLAENAEELAEVLQDLVSQYLSAPNEERMADAPLNIDRAITVLAKVEGQG